MSTRRIVHTDTTAVVAHGRVAEELGDQQRVGLDRFDLSPAAGVRTFEHSSHGDDYSISLAAGTDGHSFAIVAGDGRRTVWEGRCLPGDMESAARGCFDRVVAGRLMGMPGEQEWAASAIVSAHRDVWSAVNRGESSLNVAFDQRELKTPREVAREREIERRKGGRELE